MSKLMVPDRASSTTAAIRDQPATEDAAHAELARHRAGSLVVDRIAGGAGHADLAEADIARMGIVQRLMQSAILGVPALEKDLLDTLIGSVSVGIPLWIASHAFGLGEFVDLALFGAEGGMLIAGIMELVRFYEGAATAHSEADLRTAGAHLAHAISMLGSRKLLLALSKVSEASRIAGAAVGAGSDWLFQLFADDKTAP